MVQKETVWRSDGMSYPTRLVVGVNTKWGWINFAADKYRYSFGFIWKIVNYYFFLLYIALYTSGIKNKLTIVPMLMPPMTAHANGRCSSAPMSWVNSRGTTANMVVRLVSTMAFRRRRPAVWNVAQMSNTLKEEFHDYNLQDKNNIFSGLWCFLKNADTKNNILHIFAE